MRSDFVVATEAWRDKLLHLPCMQNCLGDAVWQCPARRKENQLEFKYPRPLSVLSPLALVHVGDGRIVPWVTVLSSAALNF